MLAFSTLARMMHLSLSHGSLVVIVSTVLFIAVSCNTPPNAPQVGNTQFNCVGHVFHWNDGGLTSLSPILAVWKEAPDSSAAELDVAMNAGGNDTLLMEHGSQGWQYGTKDPRHGSGWAPAVTVSNDSVVVEMSNGFVITKYYLKKE